MRYLKKIVQREPYISRVAFNKIIFEPFQPKQPYFCSFESFIPGAMLLKVRNSLSYVVYIKKIKEESLLHELFLLMRRMEDSWLIMFQFNTATLLILSLNLESNKVKEECLNFIQKPF